MADLKVKFCGIESPNPFWLASGPPTNTGGQVMRAFDAGWGGAVWKTIGEPIQNTSSRYGAIDFNGVKMMGLNNIELISDRPIETNLREIAEVKKRYPKHTIIASLMVESKREAWHDIVRRTEDSGVDLDTYAPRPAVAGRGSHGGYCGPAVKPIALHMVSSVAKEVDIPISGIGGIGNWRDAVEFMLLGATSVQVCTAAMHYGFRIVRDMIEGLENYLL